MSDELETAKQIATHPVSITAYASAALTWLANKVWRGMGHRIANVENLQKLGFEATWKEIDRHRDTQAKLFDQMREHEQLDAQRFERMNTESRDRHDEIMAVIGDLRADVAGIRR